jgi:GDP-L-fucose synthase
MSPKIWITGHKGMLGSAMLRCLANTQADLLLTTRKEIDLYNQAQVLDWMEKNKPDYVFHIGAKVGGIVANKKLPADFIVDNLMIQTNVIKGAHLAKVKRLVFVASNCTYPAVAPQPLKETALLSGPPDENVRAYAVSKIAGIETCLAFRRQYGCDFRVVIPSNLYGPGDNYHLENSHVVAGLLQRAHQAKVTGQPDFLVWGDGTARREILHVDDLAEALKMVMFCEESPSVLNAGSGQDLTIAELAKMVLKVVGFKGGIKFDPSKPNGTMQKFLDSSRLFGLGWSPKISTAEGLKSAYDDFLKRLKDGTLITG